MGEVRWLFRGIEARKGTVYGWFNKKLVVGQLIWELYTDLWVGKL